MRQQVSKGGRVKEYVNYVNMPEYGLDCLSRRSKSCVVNDGSLSTEVLRVADVNLFRSVFIRKREEMLGHRALRRSKGQRRRAHFSRIFQ